MKKLICIMALATLSFAQAGEKAQMATKAAKATATGLGASAAGYIATTAQGAPVIVATGIPTVLAFSGVTLAATSGYMIGSVIVKADEVYFKGSLVSNTGKLLGPVFRKIYNMTNDDQLPEDVITKDGSFKVLLQGEKH